MTKHALTAADILPMAEYAKVRHARRKALTEIKRDRRIEVGPYATFYFENFDTMWMQVHEMLFIEQGGEEQIAGELEAYNPLIPNGRELVATLMFEIADETRRRAMLAQLGGVEETVSMRVGDEAVKALYETDVDRTTADGKASAVHFLRFPFTAAQVKKMRDRSVQVMLAIGHEKYGHMAILPEAIQQALAADFDD